MNIFEHNKAVAIKRWSRVLERESTKYVQNSMKYPLLKVRVVGYLMGDGSVTVQRRDGGTHHCVCFYPDHQSMLDSFLEAFLSIYERKPSIRREKGHFSVRIDSKPITLDLLRLGSFRSTEWRVPTSILGTDLEKREWLRAFYDCEAYVGKSVIAVQSVSGQGLLGIQSLLQEFRINSRMYTYERKNKNWNRNFLLYITRKKDRQSFLNQLGFNHSVKQEKLAQYASVG